MRLPLLVHLKMKILRSPLCTDEPPTFLAVELIAEDARPRIISGGTPDTGPVTKSSSIHANKWHSLLYFESVFENEIKCVE